LIAASLCWFSMGTQVDMERISVGVDSLSSNYIFYEAVDADRDGVIDNDEIYTEITDDTIRTRYMVPGQKYFYKVVVTNNHTNAHFAFIFDNISYTGSFADYVKVAAQLVDSTSTTRATSVERTISDIAGSDTSATILTASNLATGSYELYYTVKLDASAASTYESANLTVTDVIPEFFVS
ncbi:MAG: hypothetical protein IJS17_07305, partial [Clostridia bacterium]|nr:hypothetical protein [Clostridia bacterium]